MPDVPDDSDAMAYISHRRSNWLSFSVFIERETHMVFRMARGVSGTEHLRPWDKYLLACDVLIANSKSF